LPDGFDDDMFRSYRQLANLALIPLVTIVISQHDCAALA